MIQGKEGARSPERGDHLVGDQQHVILVTDFSDTRKIVVLRDDDAARALDRFSQEHPDRVGPFAQNGLL